MNSGTEPRSRVFPDVGVGFIAQAPAEDRVELRYGSSDDRLVGTFGDEPVEWQLNRHQGVSGRMGAVELQASWTTGDNYVPEPGGWIPRPGYISDFPNIPAHLRGSFADLDAELHGVFHLDPNYSFERGSVVGRIGGVHLEATVLAASGGLGDSRTVAVEGTYGSVSFDVYATIDGGLSEGILHGSVDESVVHLDLRRPAARGSLRLGDPPLEIDVPGPQVDLAGHYHGPRELLALMIGAALEFL